MIEHKMGKNKAGIVSDIIRVCGPAGQHQSASHTILIKRGFRFD